jgi:hypothetical protein
MHAKEFAKKHGITLTAQPIDHNPNMPDPTMDHWRVRLRREGKRMTLAFSKGSGHYGAEPNIEELLDCIASDAWLVESSGTFEDFCAETGYDTDSRKAYRSYKQCVAQANRAKEFFGDLFGELLTVQE